MTKTIELLNAGFESSSNTTPEFKKYASTFKRELKARLLEIKSDKLTSIKFNQVITS